MLVELTDEMKSSSLLTDLLLEAHQLGVQIRFTAISREEYDEWVHAQSKGRYLVSVLGPSLTAAHLAAVSGVIARAGLNIDRIDRLSGRTPLDATAPRPDVHRAVGVRQPRARGRHARRADRADARFDVDVAFQHDTVFRRNRRLVAFDMDSTLIRTEVIDELARLAGVGEQVAAITEAAMRGELDFQGSFRRRVALLKGLPESALQRVVDTRAADGRRRTPDRDAATPRLQDRDPVRRLHVHRPRAAAAARHRLPARQRARHRGRRGHRRGPHRDRGRRAQGALPVGDRPGRRAEHGSGDCRRRRRQRSADAAAGGLGIAFRAKPLVRQSARQAISTLGLDGILYLLGVRDREALV